MHTYSKRFLTIVLFLAAGLPSMWVSQTELFYAERVGTTAMGSASYNCDTNQFKVISSSAILNGSEDSFQFVFRELTNDLDISARIGSNSSSLAGLMIRSGTGDNMPFAMIGLSGGKIITRYRLDSSVNIINGNEMTSTPWVRIRRQGDSVSSYTSNDGSSWVLVETRTVILGAQVAVGMAGVNGSTQFNDVNVIGPLQPIDVVDPGPTDPDPVDPGPVNPTPMDPVPVDPNPDNFSRLQVT